MYREWLEQNSIAWQYLTLRIFVIIVRNRAIVPTSDGLSHAIRLDDAVIVWKKVHNHRIQGAFRAATKLILKRILTTRGCAHLPLDAAT